MGTKVIVTIEGLDKVLSRLEEIETKGQKNLETQVGELARATEQAWKQATPQRTGKLRGGDISEVQGLSFTLKNSVHYYPFVDKGHMTPAGWRTRRGYRRAKRRSHVPGQHITDAAVQYVEQNIERYLAK